MNACPGSKWKDSHSIKCSPKDKIFSPNSVLGVGLRTEFSYSLLVIVIAIAVASCGGDGTGSGLNPGAPPQNPGVPPQTPTTLNISVASLALAVSGVARKITITNTGSTAATAVGYAASPPLPAGTTISPATCGDLAPAATCVLTVTPGSTPSAAAGNASPNPVVVTVAGSNTNTVSPSLNILGFGSVYQSGYVFAIDDTVPDTVSIGGKVAALSDQAPPSPLGIIWSSNGNGGSTANVVFDNIPGIYETSTNPPDTCNGSVDGVCNAQVIIGFYSPPTTNPAVNLANYAAGVCAGSIGGVSNWYLPAICEMGPDATSLGTGCGTSGSPTRQNMQTNLVDQGNIGNLTGVYWSSTESSVNPSSTAIAQFFATGASSFQAANNKNLQLGARCVRAITN